MPCSICVGWAETGFTHLGDYRIFVIYKALLQYPLFPHIQLHHSECFIHDVTGRASGSSCYMIHAGPCTGRT